MHIPRTAWILLALAAVLAVVIALFDWNWLRGPISGYLSTKFGRPVTIHGNLRGEFSLKPLLTADYVTLANLPWGTDPIMARAQHVGVRVDVLSLFSPSVSLPELTLVRPLLLLERDGEGHENWDFGGAPEIPRIGRLNIDAGVVHFLDSASGTDITVNVASAPAENGEIPVKFKGSGRLRKNEFTIEGTAASLLAWRTPTGRIVSTCRRRRAQPAPSSTARSFLPASTTSTERFRCRDATCRSSIPPSRCRFRGRRRIASAATSSTAAASGRSASSAARSAAAIFRDDSISIARTGDRWSMPTSSRRISIQRTWAA